MVPARSKFLHPRGGSQHHDFPQPHSWLTYAQLRTFASPSYPPSEHISVMITTGGYQGAVRGTQAVGESHGQAHRRHPSPGGTALQFSIGPLRLCSMRSSGYAHASLPVVCMGFEHGQRYARDTPEYFPTTCLCRCVHCLRRKHLCTDERSVSCALLSLSAILNDSNPTTSPVEPICTLPSLRAKWNRTNA